MLVEKAVGVKPLVFVDWTLVLIRIHDLQFVPRNGCERHHSCVEVSMLSIQLTRIGTGEVLRSVVCFIATVLSVRPPPMSSKVAIVSALNNPVFYSYIRGLTQCMLFAKLNGSCCGCSRDASQHSSKIANKTIKGQPNMETHYVFLCKHVFDGTEPPRRISRPSQPTTSESGFLITCGRGWDEGPSNLGGEPFLAAHPELRPLLSKMRIGDVYVRQEYVDGPRWERQNDQLDG